jgi:hypothetical protein
VKKRKTKGRSYERKCTGIEKAKEHALRKLLETSTEHPLTQNLFQSTSIPSTQKMVVQHVAFGPIVSLGGSTRDDAKWGGKVR